MRELDQYIEKRKIKSERKKEKVHGGGLASGKGSRYLWCGQVSGYPDLIFLSVPPRVCHHRAMSTRYSTLILSFFVSSFGSFS